MRVSAVLGSAILGLTVAATAQPALGFAEPYKYYSADKPLQALDDDVSQADMHGKFFVEEATYLRNNTNQRDPKPGGDAVFERTEYLFYVNSSAGQIWQGAGEDQSPKTTSSSWYFQYDHHPISGTAAKGRMRTQVCEDHGPLFRDPCSVWPQWTTDL